MKRMVGVFFLFILIFSPHRVQGFVFADPTGLYTTVIPDQWVYQTQRSGAALIVFYGAGERDLLYFQNVGPVADENAQAFAQRSLNLFAAPGGLDFYRLEEPLTTLDVGGISAVSCLYSYEGEEKVRLWERRVFVLLPKGQGFSIALSCSEEFLEGAGSVLDEILQKWRWLF